MLKDPVRKAFLAIYHNLVDHLQEISDRAFKGGQADLTPEEGIPATLRRDPVLTEFAVSLDNLGPEDPAPYANTSQKGKRG
jgi:hypothetical protein